MKILLALMLTFSITTITARLFAQGWVKPKNHGYFKLAENILGSNKYYAADGSTVDINNVNQFSTSIYGEFGLTNKITGIINFPFFYYTKAQQYKFYTRRQNDNSR